MRWFSQPYLNWISHEVMMMMQNRTLSSVFFTLQQIYSLGRRPGAVSRRLLLSSSNRSAPVFAPLYPNSTFGFRLRMLIYSNRKRHCHSQIISPSIRLNLSSKKSFIFKKPSRDSALLWKCGILLAASFSSTAIRATIRRSLFSGYATSFGIPD